MTDGFWLVMQVVGAGVLAVGLGYGLAQGVVGGVEYLVRRVTREQEARLDTIARVVNTNAEQHNRLADVLETAVADVREAIEEERTFLIDAATEREKAHLAGVKGHVEQVKADVKRIEGQLAGVPARSWVHRIEGNVDNLVAVVKRLRESVDGGLWTQQNADRLRIERLEAQLATLEGQVTEDFGKVSEDMAAVVEAVRALQPAEPPAKPRRRKRAS